MNKTALITGASAGIGLSFAEYLASKGYNLVLTARREKRLKEISERLTKKSSIKVTILPGDLANPETPVKIFSQLKSKGINIDFLVNNAGYSLKEKFSQNKINDVTDFLEVMMSSVTKMSLLALPYMKKQGHGRIINLGSVASFIPEYQGSLYTPAKKYILSFSKSLSKEFEGTDINVLALCPGFTHTEFHDVLGNKEAVSKFPKFMWMTADRVVEEGYLAVSEGKRVHINGIPNKILSAFFSLAPDWLSDLFMPKTIIEKSYKSSEA